MSARDHHRSARQQEEGAAHAARADDKIGVLLVNLGTPTAPTPGAVRRYLAEFLSDKRIVDLPRLLWLPLLHVVILTVRPAITARKYAKIWRGQSNESPLRYYTRKQAQALHETLSGALSGKLTVDWAMRYGAPSVRSRINVLKEAGCGRILIVPLYPQYSATTTASVADAAFDAVKDIRWQPAIRMAPAFHDDPAYIEALATVTRQRLAALDWAPERVVISFHGIPQRYFEAGDPYYCHCAKTARLLRQAMGWTEDFAPLTFQSKFGREKYLEPATGATIEALGGTGVKNLAVIMPGFVADCLETLEEIDIAARETFLSGGGENFSAVPCLNASPGMIALLETIVRREAAGWSP